MRLIIRTDVDDADRECIAWDTDHDMGMGGAKGHTAHSTVFRLPWRKRLAKRIEVADYLLNYGLQGLEASRSDYVGWLSMPTKLDAETQDKKRTEATP